MVAKRLQNLALEHAQSWILVSPKNPTAGVRWDLMIVGANGVAPSQLMDILKIEGIRLDGAYFATAEQAVTSFSAPSENTLVVMPGHMLTVPKFSSILQQPNQVYAVNGKFGVYHYAKYLEGSFLTTEDVSTSFSAQERMIVHAGPLRSSGTQLGTLYLNVGISESEVPALLNAMNATVERVLPLRGYEDKFIQENADRTTPFPMIVTTAQAFEGRSVQSAIGSTTVSIRRSGLVADLINISDQIQSRNYRDVGAKPLNLSVAANPNAQRIPKLKMVAPKQQKKVAQTTSFKSLKDHESDFCTFFPSNEEKNSDRIAFVFGNGSYNPRLGWLENPWQDATAAAELFLTLGFDVYLLTEARSKIIKQCIDRMASEQEAVEIGIFYYSGHGVQIDDQNFLLPIDATPGLVKVEELISFDSILQELRAKSKTTLAFLDACRDNPFSNIESEGLAALGTLSSRDDIEASKNEFAVMFATSPNDVASDGTGENSPFTAAFLSEFGKQGVSVQEAMVKISARVGEATSWAQTPFTRSSLSQVLFLNGDQTRNDILAASKAKAQEAEIKLRQGDFSAGARLALEALPKGLSENEALADFPEAVRAVEFLHFIPIIELAESFEGNLEGVIGENWKYALFSNYTNPSETLPIVEIATGESVAKIPFSKSSMGSSVRSRIADTPDGRFVAVPNDKSSILVLDFEEKSFKNLPIPRPNSASTSEIYVESMEFSGDGTKLFVHIARYGAFLFDVSTGKLVYSFQSINLPIGSVGLEENGSLRLLDDGHICFSLSRAQDSDDPEAGNWTFFTAGKLNPANGQVYDILWSNDSWQHWDMDCASDGQSIILIGNTNVENFDTFEYNLVDFATGLVLVSDRLPDGHASFSPDGRRVIFKAMDRLALFDVESTSFIDFYRFNDISTFAHPAALVSVNGRLDFETFAESSSMLPSIYDLDLPLDQIVSSVLTKLPPDLVADLEQNRISLSGAR